MIKSVIMRIDAQNKNRRCMGMVSVRFTLLLMLLSIKSEGITLLELPPQEIESDQSEAQEVGRITLD